MDTLGGWMQEIRYFYKRQLSFPLSTHAQALWSYLMYRGNEAFWHFPIRLSLMELAGATGMSLTMVKRARRELEEYGYIRHKAFGGNRPAGYYMLSNIHIGQQMGPKLPNLAPKEAAKAEGAD
ncbi:MAG: helix-turn-helix domain-containing protein [Selenomonas sp.]|uniref:helix-turn-helix domain-containing protein n=1 Tax=Selenomonas sp. TaxID=2053611 RepID=UPI0025EEB9FE|nr:helix-turn-helix domain-containing protein [Selenomonas sp.]MCR5437992.1 helix-turn-helix domain-containing protein [Selenomonas sp.]